MLARLQRATTLALLVLAAGWAVLAWRAGHPVVALVGAAAVLFAHAGVLAVEFVAMRRVHGNDPAPLPRWGQIVRAWAGEVLTGLQVFCWRQPFRSERWPDQLPEDAGGRTGVVLVHGFVCNRGVWNHWLARLTAQRCPFIAVNMDAVFGSIDDGAQAIDAAVERLQRATHRPPVIVAHSMGGLAVRRWWAQRPGVALRRVITLGTPHRGTWLARFALSLNGQQMRPGSTWLQTLDVQASVDHPACFTCFYSHCDNVVFPPQNATLPGADNRHLEGVAHVRMIDRPEPWLELQRWLS